MVCSWLGGGAGGVGGGSGEWHGGNTSPGTTFASGRMFGFFSLNLLCTVCVSGFGKYNTCNFMNMSCVFCLLEPGGSILILVI